MTVKRISKHKCANSTFLCTHLADGLIVSDPMAEMSDDRTASPPLMQPVILSMEVDDEDSFESEYRLQIGNQVKYLIISPRTFNRDTLSFPIQSLPRLPYNEEW